jgi:hypothetical protein
VRRREVGQRLRQQVGHRDEGRRQPHAAGQAQVAPEQAALDVVDARRDRTRFLASSSPASVST